MSQSDISAALPANAKRSTLSYVTKWAFDLFAIASGGATLFAMATKLMGTHHFFQTFRTHWREYSDWLWGALGLPLSTATPFSEALIVPLNILGSFLILGFTSVPVLVWAKTEIASLKYKSVLKPLMNPAWHPVTKELWGSFFTASLAYGLGFSTLHAFAYPTFNDLIPNIYWSQNYYMVILYVAALFAFMAVRLMRFTAISEFVNAEAGRLLSYNKSTSDFDTEWRASEPSYKKITEEEQDIGERVKRHSREWGEWHNRYTLAREHHLDLLRMKEKYDVPALTSWHAAAQSLRKYIADGNDASEFLHRITIRLIWTATVGAALIGANFAALKLSI
jgi:hypothetical protein